MSEETQTAVEAPQRRGASGLFPVLVAALVAGCLAYGAAVWRYAGIVETKDAAVASQSAAIEGLNASLTNLRTENSELRSRLTAAEADVARARRPRDPDGIFQMGEQVGRVTGASEDRAASKVTFERIQGNGNFDRAKAFEYRDMTLVVKSHKRAITAFTGRGVQTELSGVEAEISKVQGAQ